MNPRHLVRSSPYAILTFIFITGCRGEAPSSWAGTIDTLPNGTIVVENPAAGTWDSTNAWTLEEDLVVGGSDTVLELSLVSALEVDSAGRIYLLDPQRHRLFILGPDGRLLKTVGREGAGPGEFRGPNGLGWDAAGRLWVVEGPGQRYSIFDADGRFSHTRPRTTGSYGFLWMGRFLNDGTLVEQVTRRQSGSALQTLLVRMDSAGVATGDTLAFAPKTLDDQAFDFRNREGIGTIMSVPYLPSEWRWVDPRGSVWTGNTGSYELVQLRLTWVTGAGAAGPDTIRIIRKPHEPVLVTPSERDSVIDHVRKIAQGQSFDADRIPRAKPVLTRMLTDNQGNIWVMPTLPSGTAGSRFDVFNPEGTYRGMIETDRRVSGFFPLAFHGDKLYGVVEGEDGIPAVVRWGVVRR